MKRTAILMAAVMAVGGISLAANAAQTNQIPASYDAAIRHVIVNMTDNALAPHDMRRLVTSFPGSDMRRLIHSTGYSQDYGLNLDSRIERICRTWRETYHHDFDVRALGAALDSQFATIRVSTHDPNRATVYVKAADGEPEVRLSVIRQMGQWSVMTPRALTADKLRSNLDSEFARLDVKSSQFPRHESDAYRLLAHHVALAISARPTQAAIVITPAKTVATTEKPAPAVLKPAPAQQVSTNSTNASHHWWQIWNW